MHSAATKTAHRSHPRKDGRHAFAWQGWGVVVPIEWNAIRLEGDWDRGFALLADLSGPKLGLRWSASKTEDVGQIGKLVKQAICGELGQLAESEAVADAPPGDWVGGRRFCEPEPPGRDVWVGKSPASGRIVELIYHVDRRDAVLAAELLPTLFDTAPTAETAWAVLDLSCRIPAGFRLVSQGLAAGDLRLTFEKGRQRISVRQIGPARLALSRQPLEKWLEQQLYPSRKFYKTEGKPAPVTIADAVSGLRQNQSKKRRAFLFRSIPRAVSTLILHDRARDRIVLVQADDEKSAIALAGTVGPAAREEAE